MASHSTRTNLPEKQPQNTNSKALDIHMRKCELQIRTLLLCNPAIPVPAPVPVPTLLSPHIIAVFDSTNDFGSSYFGSLEILDFQSKFDCTFPNSTPLFVMPSPSKLSIPMSIDSTFALTVIHEFVDQCKFQVFLPINCSDYVGTANRDDAASLHTKVQTLKKLQSCRVVGQDR